MLVDDRMRLLERDKLPTTDLMSCDVEYQQLIEVDLILSDMQDQEEQAA
jgi:hypothetical protein